MRGETMKDKSKKSTYSTTFGVDPFFSHHSTIFDVERTDLARLQANLEIKKATSV